MKTQSLASAFQAALARTNQNRELETPASRDDLLLLALQKSATAMDQIVSRRIGLITEAICLAP